MVVEPRIEERFAVDILRRHLGARFTQLDDNTSDGMVDGLFELPDGALGALEVTTLADPAAMEFESLTLGSDWSGRVDGVSWYWAIWIRPGLDLRAVASHLGTVLRSCELAGVHELVRGLWLDDSPSHRWMRERIDHIHGVGSDSARSPGLVELIPDAGHGAMIGPDLSATVDEWLRMSLRTPHLEAKIDKLRRSGRPSRHLFLRLHESAAPDDVMYVLAFTSAVPKLAPDPAHNLAGLWVDPRWGQSLRWLEDRGWARFEP